MTVTVRPYKRGGWEVDIVLTFPGRPKIRERKKCPLPTKAAAKQWGDTNAAVIHRTRQRHVQQA